MVYGAGAGGSRLGAACWRRVSRGAWHSAFGIVSFAVLGFAATFVPATAYESWAKSHYRIWGSSAITTFYASEAW